MIGVIQFPGSCDERDALEAIRRVGDGRLVHRLGNLDRYVRKIGDVGQQPRTRLNWVDVAGTGFGGGVKHPLRDLCSADGVASRVHDNVALVIQDAVWHAQYED